MPIYRLSVSILSRSSGGSTLAAAAYRTASRLTELGQTAFDAVAAAAYRSGQSLEGQGTTHDYGRKSDVRHSEILLPEGAAPWLADRSRLWNAVEASERRKDSQLAREILVTLPRELAPEDRLSLIRGFAQEQLTARGMVVDLAIHDGRARDGGRHPHAHLLLTMRRLDPTNKTGFGKKETAWNSRALLQTWRQAWAGHVNRALERAAIPERVDHRTLEAQRQDALARGDWDQAASLDREPEPKLGRAAAALERQGQRTERGDLLREVHARNALRREAYALVAAFGERAKAAFLELRERTGDALTAFASWARERQAVLLDTGRDLLARLRNAITPGRPAPGTAEPTVGRPAPEAALDRLRRQLGPERSVEASPQAPAPEDSLSRLQRGFEPEGRGSKPELPARTQDAVDRVAARLAAERRQQAGPEPDPAGQGGTSTPELSARTKDAVARIGERLAAERRERRPEPEPRGRTRERTRDPGRER